MGLFVSQWVFGEETFLEICNAYWEPRLILQPLAKEKAVLGFSFLSREGESLLYSVVPKHSYKEFFTRYNYALSYIVDKLNIAEYVRNLVKENVPDGQLTKEAFALMDDQFFYEISNFDFVNQVPLFERLSSLIFFNSWELIKHYKFIYYPQGGTQDE